MSDTPETDAAVMESNGQWSFVLKETCQRLERERDEAREELETSQAVIRALRARIGKDSVEIEQLTRERDEAREALKKCREDSVCYAEHMRKSGYVKAFKESQENADKAMGILNKLEAAK